MKSKAARIASIIGSCIAFGVVAFFGIMVGIFALACGGTPVVIIIVVPILLLMAVGLVRHIRHHVRMIRAAGAGQPVAGPVATDLNLYALTTYIGEARAYGMSDEQAVANLQVQGWSNDEIKRAMALVPRV